MKAVNTLPKKPEPLTPEQLIAIPGCSHYSIPEAETILKSIRSFCKILLETNRQIQNSNHIDNQQVVYLDQEKDGQNPVPHITNHSTKNNAA